jgi:hypothetical protein
MEKGVGKVVEKMGTVAQEFFILRVVIHGHVRDDQLAVIFKHGARRSVM